MKPHNLQQKKNNSNDNKHAGIPALETANNVFLFLTLFKTYVGLIFHLYPSSQDVV